MLMDKYKKWKKEKQALVAQAMMQASQTIGRYHPNRIVNFVSFEYTFCKVFPTRDHNLSII